MKSTLKSSLKEAVAGYLFVMPNFLGFLVFTSLPVVASFFIAFFQWDLITEPKFVGLENFINLLSFHHENGAIVSNDPDFWKFLGNTFFLMLGIPLNMAASLILAVIMNKKLKGIVIFRTVYFLPSICAGVAIYMLWQWIYNPDFGLLNTLIRKLSFGIFNGPEWLTSTAWAKPALILMGVWTTMGGYNMILYLAGLQGIPPELYEAAAIDGASPWQKFRHVTWPMLTPTTFFIFIMSMIAGFQGGFEQAYIMTGGGPAGSTTTIEYYIFNNVYVWQHMGYAASIAWILFVIIFVINLFIWKYGGKVVHY
ncbi:MAG: sugar ABC transporter permease [Candidatus Ancaeobacter aquaticus]|nr:sugar ABC transporter permease [Candidatus Ancaeobacter aquaticus]